VKHLSTRTSELASLCAELGLETTESVLKKLVRYLDAVLEANVTVNLTRITDPDQALRLHLLDSMTALPEVDSSPSGRMCDIGTGAGFPGVPIALVTGRKCVLLDSVRKKGDATARILAELELGAGITVCHDRAEQHARTHSGEYAVVTARAVAPLASLVELAAPLLEVGGMLIALKGDPSAEEYSSGLEAAKVVGLSLESRRDFALPGGGEQRCVIAIRRTGHSRVELPRREGLAQHAPLG